MKNIFTIGLFLLFSLSAFAQHSINGVVQNQNGEPLAGVNIQEKGTYNGTSTGPDGRFSLQASSEQATLIFSYIGYGSVEMRLEGQNDLTITLQEGVVNVG